MISTARRTVSSSRLALRHLIDGYDSLAASDALKTYKRRKKPPPPTRTRTTTTTKTCADCRTSMTPLWRRGPYGPRSLCNACGIRYKRRRAMANRVKGSKSNAISADSINEEEEEEEEEEGEEEGKKKVVMVMEDEQKKEVEDDGGGYGKQEAEAALLLMSLSSGLFVSS